MILCLLILYLPVWLRCQYYMNVNMCESCSDLGLSRLQSIYLNSLINYGIDWNYVFFRIISELYSFCTHMEQQCPLWSLLWLCYPLAVCPSLSTDPCVHFTITRYVYNLQHKRIVWHIEPSFIVIQLFTGF